MANSSSTLPSLDTASETNAVTNGVVSSTLSSCDNTSSPFSSSSGAVGSPLSEDASTALLDASRGLFVQGSAPREPAEFSFASHDDIMASGLASDEYLRTVADYETDVDADLPDYSPHPADGFFHPRCRGSCVPSGQQFGECSSCVRYLAILGRDSTPAGSPEHAFYSAFVDLLRVRRGPAPQVGFGSDELGALFSSSIESVKTTFSDLSATLDAHRATVLTGLACIIAAYALYKSDSFITLGIRHLADVARGRFGFSSTYNADVPVSGDAGNRVFRDIVGQKYFQRPGLFTPVCRLYDLADPSIHEDEVAAVMRRAGVPESHLLVLMDAYDAFFRDPHNPDQASLVLSSQARHYDDPRINATMPALRALDGPSGESGMIPARWCDDGTLAVKLGPDRLALKPDDKVVWHVGEVRSAALDHVIVPAGDIDGTVYCLDVSGPTASGRSHQPEYAALAQLSELGLVGWGAVNNHITTSQLSRLLGHAVDLDTYPDSLGLGLVDSLRRREFKVPTWVGPCGGSVQFRCYDAARGLWGPFDYSELANEVRDLIRVLSDVGRLYPATHPAIRNKVVVFVPVVWAAVRLVSSRRSAPDGMPSEQWGSVVENVERSWASFGGIAAGIAGLALSKGLVSNLLGLLKLNPTLPDFLTEFFMTVAGYFCPSPDDVSASDRMLYTHGIAYRRSADAIGKLLADHSLHELGSQRDAAIRAVLVYDEAAGMLGKPCPSWAREASTVVRSFVSANSTNKPKWSVVASGAALSRIEPLSISIRGVPGGGKDLLASALSLALAKSIAPTGVDVYQYKPSTDDFSFEGLNTVVNDGGRIRGSVGLIYSDFGQASQVQDRSRDAKFLIDVINTAPYAVPRAQAHDKGAVFCNPFFVFLTNNLTPEKLVQWPMTDAKAVDRRIHVEFDLAPPAPGATTYDGCRLLVVKWPRGASGGPAVGTYLSYSEAYRHLSELLSARMRWAADNHVQQCEFLSGLPLVPLDDAALRTIIDQTDTERSTFPEAQMDKGVAAGIVAGALACLIVAPSIARRIGGQIGDGFRDRTPSIVDEAASRAEALLTERADGVADTLVSAFSSAVSRGASSAGSSVASAVAGAGASALAFGRTVLHRYGLALVALGAAVAGGLQVAKMVLGPDPKTPEEQARYSGGPGVKGFKVPVTKMVAGRDPSAGAVPQAFGSSNISNEDRGFMDNLRKSCAQLALACVGPGGTLVVHTVYGVNGNSGIVVPGHFARPLAGAGSEVAAFGYGESMVHGDSKPRTGCLLLVSSSGVYQYDPSPAAVRYNEERDLGIIPYPDTWAKVASATTKFWRGDEFEAATASGSFPQNGYLVGVSRMERASAKTFRLLTGPGVNGPQAINTPFTGGHYVPKCAYGNTTSLHVLGYTAATVSGNCGLIAVAISRSVRQCVGIHVCGNPSVPSQGGAAIVHFEDIGAAAQGDVQVTVLPGSHYPVQAAFGSLLLSGPHENTRPYHRDTRYTRFAGIPGEPSTLPALESDPVARNLSALLKRGSAQKPYVCSDDDRDDWRLALSVATSDVPPGIARKLTIDEAVSGVPPGEFGSHGVGPLLLSTSAGPLVAPWCDKGPTKAAYVAVAPDGSRTLDAGVRHAVEHFWAEASEGRVTVYPSGVSEKDELLPAAKVRGNRVRHIHPEMLHCTLIERQALSGLFALCSSLGLSLGFGPGLNLHSSAQAAAVKDKYISDCTIAGDFGSFDDSQIAFKVQWAVRTLCSKVRGLSSADVEALVALCSLPSGKLGPGHIDRAGGNNSGNAGTTLFNCFIAHADLLLAANDSIAEALADVSASPHFLGRASWTDIPLRERLEYVRSHFPVITFGDDHLGEASFFRGLVTMPGIARALDRRWGVDYTTSTKTAVSEDYSTDVTFLGRRFAVVDGAVRAQLDLDIIDDMTRYNTARDDETRLTQYSARVICASLEWAHHGRDVFDSKIAQLKDNGPGLVHPASCSPIPWPEYDTVVDTYLSVYPAEHMLDWGDSWGPGDGSGTEWAHTPFGGWAPAASVDLGGPVEQMDTVGAKPSTTSAANAKIHDASSSTAAVAADRAPGLVPVGGDAVTMTTAELRRPRVVYSGPIPTSTTAGTSVLSFDVGRAFLAGSTAGSTGPTFVTQRVSYNAYIQMDVKVTVRVTTNKYVQGAVLVVANPGDAYDGLANADRSLTYNSGFPGAMLDINRDTEVSLICYNRSPRVMVPVAELVDPTVPPGLLGTVDIVCAADFLDVSGSTTTSSPVISVSIEPLNLVLAGRTTDTITSVPSGVISRTYRPHGHYAPPSPASQLDVRTLGAKPEPVGGLVSTLVHARYVDDEADLDDRLKRPEPCMYAGDLVIAPTVGSATHTGGVLYCGADGSQVSYLVSPTGVLQEGPGLSIPNFLDHCRLCFSFYRGGLRWQGTFLEPEGQTAGPIVYISQSQQCKAVWGSGLAGRAVVYPMAGSVGEPLAMVDTRLSRQFSVETAANATSVIEPTGIPNSVGRTPTNFGPGFVNPGPVPLLFRVDAGVTAPTVVNLFRSAADSFQFSYTKGPGQVVYFGFQPGGSQSIYGPGWVSIDPALFSVVGSPLRPGPTAQMQSVGSIVGEAVAKSADAVIAQVSAPARAPEATSFAGSVIDSVAGVAKGIAGFFGLDKPTSLQAITPTAPHVTPQVTHGAGLFSGVRLTHRPDEVSAVVTDGALGGHEDMSVRALCSKPSILRSFKWLAANAPNTTLFSTSVDPRYSEQTTDVTASGATAPWGTAVEATLIGHTCMPYQLWQGTLVYTFVLTRSFGIDGRFRVSFVPSTSTTISGAPDDINYVDYDLSGRPDGVFEFAVPFISPDLYAGTATGTLVVTSLSELSVPDTASGAFAEFTVFISSPDMRVARPIPCYGVRLADVRVATS